MGIFNLFGKREKKPLEKAADEDELVTVQIEVNRSQLGVLQDAMKLADLFYSSPSFEAERSRIEEEESRRLAELEEQQNRRMEALRERGVSVQEFSTAKGKDDLFRISEALCGLNLKALGPCERETIAWQKLTQTGKVPKCVAIYCTHWVIQEGEYHQSYVTCEVSYLADGTPYAAWINDLRGSGTYYKVKTVDGELALVAENPA